jgi:hypothetical protein
VTIDGDGTSIDVASASHRPAPTDASLWRHRDFGYFSGGQTVSMVGSAISFIALPLVAVSLLHIDPFGMSLLSTDRADIDPVGIGRAGLGAAGATAPVG